jgi:hypothetical protein
MVGRRTDAGGSQGDISDDGIHAIVQHTGELVESFRVDEPDRGAPLRTFMSTTSLEHRGGNSGDLFAAVAPERADVVDGCRAARWGGEE